MEVSAQTVTVESGGSSRSTVSGMVCGTLTTRTVVSMKPSVSTTTRQIVSATPSSEEAV